MRVSTAQFYHQNSLQLTNKQSDVNEQVEYISSGKRVLTAKDDAVHYGTLNGYKEELSNINKYERNITLAENRTSLQDTLLSNTEGFLQKIKQDFIQANNGSLNDTDLLSLSQLTRNSFEQILDIANTKDETGGYLFAGFQTDKQPFQLQADNSVNYVGDNGTRELQISKNLTVPTNQSGDAVFEKIPNHQGDFSTNYINNTSGISVTKAVVSDRGNYNTAANPPNYNFSFTSATDLTITDGNGAVVFNTNSYSEGQTISFNGIEVSLDGNPLPGDEFELTPQENISIFETINRAINWIETGSGHSVSTTGVIDYNDILSQLDNVLNHVTSRRANAGVSAQLIDNQKFSNEERALTLEKAKSNIEDLDFAQAIATFEQSKVALQAAQQTFVQIKDLSLFNFI